MNDTIKITNKNGKIIKQGNFTEPEIRMVARAGYRVFENGNEITQKLTGLFEAIDKKDTDLQ